MQSFAVVVFPVLLMLFALSMERVEEHLHRLTVRPQDVEDFLDNASHDDVATLAREGMPDALAQMKSRRSAERHFD